MAHVPRDEAFAKYVLQTGMATPAQLEKARAGAEGVPLADALVRDGVLTPSQREAVDRKLDAQDGASVVGGCRLLRKLGEGGMGAVYLAEEVETRRRVALKVLPKKLAEDEAFRRRFQREAAAAAALDHPSIARGYRSGEDRGFHFYVMEYCRGETLGKRLKRQGALPVPEATALILDIAKGLQYAHARGFVHRDIKPDNLLVPPDGGVKILDLGLSKNLEDSGATFQTATGAALGTPHYIAPEQARGDKSLDGRADIYSLGATYYHMVTGRVPFPGSSVFEIIHKHLTEQLPDPRDLRPEVPEKVVFVLRRMLGKEPDDRYSGSDELVAELERMVRGEPFTTSVLDPARSSIAPPRKTVRRRVEPSRGPAWAGVAVAGVVSTVALVWALSGSTPPPPPPPAVARRPSPPPPPPVVPVEMPDTPAPPPSEPSHKEPPEAVKKPETTPAPDPPKPPEPEPPRPAPSEPVPAVPPAPPAPPPPAKRPEPAPEALRSAEAEFRAPLKADYARRGPSDKLALARKLLAMEAPADAARDFVRLRDARDQAAAGGDAALALEAVDALDKAFVVDVLEARAEGLGQLDNLRTIPAARAAAEACEKALEDAIAADRFDLTARLAQKAEAAARDADDEALLARLRARAKDAAAWAKEIASLQGYVERLRTQPDDPASNTALGRFRCFTKGDWAAGLPMLARGSDATLRAVAAKDLAAPEDAAAQSEICDGWIAQAAKERSSPARRDRILARARLWFEKCSEHLTASERTRLSKAVGADATRPPAPAGAPTPTAPPVVRFSGGRTGYGLLRLVDPARDSVNGRWQEEGDALRSPDTGENFNAGSARLFIPYAPTGEYELFIEVERRSGDEDLVLGLLTPDGRPFAAVLDGWFRDGGSGICHAPNRWDKKVEGPQRVLRTGVRHWLGIHVKRDAFRIMIDARELFRHEDYSTLGMPAYVQVPGRSAGFILGSVRSTFLLHHVVFIPVVNGRPQPPR